MNQRPLPRPNFWVYRPAQALTPPLLFMNAVTRWLGFFTLATYRSARAHLLMVLSSGLPSDVQRITAVNGSALVDRQPSKFERSTYKSLGPPPSTVPLHKREHRSHVPIDRITTTIILEAFPSVGHFPKSLSERLAVRHSHEPINPEGHSRFDYRDRLVE
jgi:hypothetical protein